MNSTLFHRIAARERGREIEIFERRRGNSAYNLGVVTSHIGRGPEDKKKKGYKTAQHTQKKKEKQDGLVHEGAQIKCV